MAFTWLITLSISIVVPFSSVPVVRPQMRLSLVRASLISRVLLLVFSSRPSRIAFTLSGLLYHNISLPPSLAVGLMSL